MGSVGCYPIFIFIDLVFHHNNTLACFKNQCTFIVVLFVLDSCLSYSKFFPLKLKKLRDFQFNWDFLGV